MRKMYPAAGVMMTKFAANTASRCSVKVETVTMRGGCTSGCNGGPYLVLATTAIRTADTLILSYLDSLVIVTIMLKRYLEHCRFCLGIMLFGLLVLLDSKSNNLTSNSLSNPMTLNYGTVESNGFSTIFLF